MRVCDDVFELSIGGLEIALNRRGAQDVVGALTYALLATVPVEPPRRPARKPRRRRRTAN